jgi:RNA polymerase sigma factor (TIGR02999 family)
VNAAASEVIRPGDEAEPVGDSRPPKTSAVAPARTIPRMTAATLTAVREEAPSNDALFSALYQELHRLARREAARFGAAEVLSATTLLHEVYLDMTERVGLRFVERGCFLAYAARTMRTRAIDRARQRGSQKRGGDLDITSLDTQHADECASPDALSQIGAALDELAILEPALANVVDLKFFCGFTMTEIARLQGVSERTVQRYWEKARLLLYRALRS